MRLTSLLLLAAASLFGQMKMNQLWIITNPAGTTTGEISWDALNGTGFVSVKAPNTMSGGYALTWPLADAVGCLQSNGAGQLTFGACGGAAPLTLTADSVWASSNPQLRLRGLTDNTRQLWIAYDTTANLAYLQAHQVGIAARDLALQPGGANVCVGCWTSRALLTVDGAIDNAPGGGTTQYALLRNIRMADYAGGTAYWDFLVLANGGTSQLSIRDNGGAAVVTFRRVFSGLPADEADVFVDLLPDANRSQSLGASSRLWDTVWAYDVQASNRVYANGGVVATSASSSFSNMAITGSITPALSGIGSIGSSFNVFGSGYFNTLNITSQIVAGGFSISTSEIGALDNVTSNIQTQLNGKPGLGGTNTWTGTNTFSNTVTINNSLTVNGYDFTLWGDFELHGAIIMPGGVGMGGTVSCGSGQAIKSITASGGVILGATCGAP